jgi:hypothetical protein
MLAKIYERLEDGGGGAVAELLLRPAARDHGDRRHSRGCCRLDIPPRVADHHRFVGAGLLERRHDDIRMRFRPLDVQPFASMSAPARARTKLSPPMPMWRWARHTGTTISWSRNARYHARAWW